MKESEPNNPMQLDSDIYIFFFLNCDGVVHNLEYGNIFLFIAEELIGII